MNVVLTVEAVFVLILLICFVFMRRADERKRREWNRFIDESVAEVRRVTNRGRDGGAG